MQENVLLTQQPARTGASLQLPESVIEERNVRAVAQKDSGAHAADPQEFERRVLDWFAMNSSVPSVSSVVKGFASPEN